MRVKFTGYVEIDESEVDGMSDMDWAVMNQMHMAANSVNADDFYSQLEMKWEIVEPKVNITKPTS
jgi:hypothetical protein